MKLYLKNRKKEIISRTNRSTPIQNNTTNYNNLTQTNSLSDSQTRNQTQLVNINVERSKSWVLQINRNNRIV